MAFELPAGAVAPRGFDLDELRFPLKSVGSFAKLRYGRALQEGKRRAGTVPVFGTNGQCGTHDTALALPPGVILGRKGQGHLGVKWCDVPFWVIDTAYYADLDKSIVDPKWFYYITDFVGLDELKTGEKPGLARELFERQLFPVPPLPKQKAIAAILGALDDKIDLNRQMNRTLEEMASALFKSWFIDFDPVTAKLEGRQPFGMDAATAALFPAEFEETGDGVAPMGWRYSTVGAESARCGGCIQTGPFGSQLHASDYVDAGVPVVMPQDIANRSVQLAKIVRVREHDANRLHRHRVRIGDVVFSRRGDVERHALVTEREVGWLCGTGCLLVRLGPRWPSPYYASMMLDCRDSKEWISQHAVGSTMPNLNTSILSDVPILVPADDVLRRFEAVTHPWRSLVEWNIGESETLTALRDLLLPQLLSGEIRIRDAENLVEGTL
jgi:type I restriction enzyme S subunit